MASMKATVEPLPLVPATVITRAAGRPSAIRPATSCTRSRPIWMACGCWRSICASQSARVRWGCGMVTPWAGTWSMAGHHPACGRVRLQRAVLGLAKERGVVGAVVQAHHFQAVQVRAFEQVERGRSLAEGPQLADRQAQDPAQDDAVDRIVGDQQQGIVRAQLLGGAGQATPGAVQHLAQRFAARHQHRVRLLAPCTQAGRVLLVDLAGKQPFPLAVGDFLATRIYTYVYMLHSRLLVLAS